MADLPGIIEGAHLGKGIGHRFLRHIERNSVLLFLIPIDADNIKNEYKILLNELKQYNPELLNKPRLLAISKCDMADDELMKLIRKELPRQVPHVFISSATGLNIQKLKDKIWEMINEPLLND
jgi:GTP-binding protein